MLIYDVQTYELGLISDNHTRIRGLLVMTSKYFASLKREGFPNDVTQYFHEY